MNRSICAGLLLLIVLLFPGCRTLPEPTLSRFVFEKAQMGVPFRIILYAEFETKAEQAATAAFDRIADLNQIMSDYETDSELNELSRSSGSGRAVPVSADLWNVLRLSERIAKDSGGAFDITIGPCVSLWRKARRERRLPEADLLSDAKARVGYTNLVVNAADRTVRLLVPNMRLDLGGIGKGYAADAALQVLREAGCPRALVAASGDLAIGDAPPGRDGWRIELIGSDVAGGPGPEFIEIANAGVSTSGDLSQFVEIDGRRYSHVLDPFTCIGLTNHALSTVVAENCTIADALDTTLTLVPEQAARRLADRYKVAMRLFWIAQEKPRTLVNGRFKRLKRVETTPTGSSPARD